jgi:zinc and cadmium transporter
LIPIGVALFFAGLSFAGQDATERITAAALAFSAGTFLCIALSDLLPELHFHAHDRVKLSLSLLAGLLLMFIAAAWE